ncbi:MAG: glucosamine-6-phosphate deaminase [Planctomycetes bacterium]|nr:glucosamine-6-phosphate deaminase [Planctomycetota bacterium]
MHVPPRPSVRELHGLPLRVFVVDSAPELAALLARELVDVVRGELAANRDPVLGLATGRTPLALYAEFARLVAEERLDLSRLTSFHLDEYLGLPRDHPASFRARMREVLYRRIGHPDERAKFPVECDRTEGLDGACADYERAIVESGGIAWQLLGIGLNGHVAFNEPGATADSRTRVVQLSESTRRANRPDFGPGEEVPRRAVTVGIATIRDARRLRLVALGRSKARIVRELLHSLVSSAIPATLLREHSGAELWCDAAAAGEPHRD